MANLESANAKLLRSGEFSDFTLVCEGKKFHVHKAIVCPQSPVIAAALKSEFKEAKTNTIEVNFELLMVKCMLEFIYTGKYSEVLRPDQPTQSTQPPSTGADKQPAQSTPKEEGEKNPATLPTISDRLIYHARVNIIADYYGVTDLAKTSADRIQTMLQKNWSADDFCKLIEVTTGSTGDKNLRQVFVKASDDHVLELIEKDIFSEGKIADDLAAEVLKATIGTFNSDRIKVLGLRSEIEAKNRKIKGLEANLDELANVLAKTRMCCKRECKQLFGCLVQKPSENPERRWFVRCATCSCRHIYDRRSDSATLAPPPFKNDALSSTNISDQSHPRGIQTR